jgi:chromodomain-helicase-DNA-binding protein 7
VVYYDAAGAEGRRLNFEYEAYYTDILKRGRLSKKSKLIKFNIMITSYEIFIQDFEDVFLPIPWQFCIIDEAHRLKNKNARMLAMLKQLPLRRYALLTGTPLQNNTEELWTLLNFLEPDTFPSIDAFLAKYGKIETKE